LNGDLTGITHNFVGGTIAFSYGYNNAHELIYSGSSDSVSVWHPSGSSSVSYATADSVNKYPTVGGVSYGYDGNGNLITDGVWTYGFNTQNQLLSASKSGVTASFVYDPLNRQTQKTVGTAKSRYIYSGWQRIADYDGVTDALQTRYVYGTGVDEPLVAITAGGTLSYYHQDRLGSVAATSDSGGVIVNKNKFGPFGDVDSLTGTFGFTGQRYDSELSLYYYKNRVYSPALGRFLQPDPAGYIDSINLYSYVNNAPTNMTDSLGLWGDWGPWAVGPGAEGGYGPGNGGFGTGMGPLGPSTGHYYYNPETDSFRPDIIFADPALDPNYKGWKPGDPINPLTYENDVSNYVGWLMQHGTNRDFFMDRNGKAYDTQFNKDFGNALRHILATANLTLGGNFPLTAQLAMLTHEFYQNGKIPLLADPKDSHIDIGNNATGAALADNYGGNWQQIGAAAVNYSFAQALNALWNR
jgi:RHS repeat-associated protein